MPGEAAPADPGMAGIIIRSEKYIWQDPIFFAGPI